MRSLADELRVLSRRSKVAELMLRGVRNQSEICRQLGMDEKSQRATICRGVRTIKEEWKQRTAFKADEYIGADLARLDMIERAAWEGWERSLLDAETLEAATVRNPADPAQTEERAKKVIRGQTGDPMFLRIVLDCVKQRRGLLGLDRPKRKATDGDAKADPIIQVLRIRDGKIQVCDEACDTPGGS